MIIQVIIPTLNRPAEVKANIHHCINAIRKFDFGGPVEIILSENSSDPEKEIEESWIKEIIKESKNNNINFIFKKRTSRQSLGRHVNLLMAESHAKWQLWLGDDDCLSSSYWENIAKITRSTDQTVVACFASYQPVSQHQFFEACHNPQNIHHKTADVQYTGPLTSAQSREIAKFILRGNQLSGLLFRSDVVRNTLAGINPENLYPWMTLMGESLKRGRIAIISSKEIYVTSDIPKLFSYGKDGLQGEIVEAISSIPSLSKWEKFHTQVNAMRNRTCHWRMRMTSTTVTGMIANTLNLFKDPRIPRIALIFSLPFYFKYFVKIAIQKQLGRDKNLPLSS